MLDRLKREDLLVKYNTYLIPPWFDPDNLPKGEAIGCENAGKKEQSV